MKLQQNMANVLRAMKKASGKSMTEFSEQLEISRSALQEYMSGEGNPNMTTVEHMAERLGVSPFLLYFGALGEEQIEVLLQLLETLKLLEGLTPARRRRFAQLLLDMVRLWEETINDG